jgi:acyl carrier protein
MAAQGDTAARVREILARHATTRGVEEIDDADELGADLGLDSLDCLQIEVEIENEFQAWPDLDQPWINPEMTVEQLVAAVQGRVGA